MNERSKRILAGLVPTLGLVTVVDVTVYGFRLFLERPTTTGRIIPAVSTTWAAADRVSERMRAA